MANVLSRLREPRLRVLQAPNPVLGAIDEILPELAKLFDDIATATYDGLGITRDAFGVAETEAGRILLEFAKRQGLDAAFDVVGNLNVAPANELQADPDVLIGSHIDSVPHGGNYDGLAGVIAGIAVLVAQQRHGLLPNNKLRAVGFRGEESPWFGAAYLGSRLFTGQMTRAEADALTRFDTGLSLTRHMEILGLDPAAIGRPCIPVRRLKAYFELHIEQAPILEAMNRPVAVATAIRGNIRYPFAKCLGRYAHSGAVPRDLRCDALVASAKLIAFADDYWRAVNETGNDDLVFTCGVFGTDAAKHAMTKVPGEVSFSLNIGSIDDAIMSRMHESVMARAKELEQEHGVHFVLGKRMDTSAVALDPRMLELVETRAREIKLPLHRMPTVGHDAAIFARANVPTSVILVRNANGSHNPDEHMEIGDFSRGLKVLASTVANLE